MATQAPLNFSSGTVPTSMHFMYYWVVSHKISKIVYIVHIVKHEDFNFSIGIQVHTGNPQIQ